MPISMSRYHHAVMLSCYALCKWYHNALLCGDLAIVLDGDLVVALEGADGVIRDLGSEALDEGELGDDLVGC